ncbi:MAG: LysM peptidoglycan-binding domain-containing protein, partial [Bacteroidales bacterium]|nr:LysM peptidoglycan-binding domain-containing protein [Bacteroidales bacterium]
ACRYLADLYRLYGDWWSCVLAYANSPAALSHAAWTPGKEGFLWHMFETRALPEVEIVRNLLACIYVYDASERINSSQKIVDSLLLVEQKMMSEPVPAMKPASAAKDSSRTPAPATSTAAKPAAAVATSAPRSAAETAEPVIYTVKLGDTLSQIAERHHVKLSDLKRWNNLKRDFIREGQKLKIYP